MNFKTLLRKYRASIAEEWLYRLQNEVSPNYSARPREELVQTISDAIDANFAALVQDDFSKLDEAIGEIGKLRGKAGFRLSEVQKAFELYRPIVVALIERETSGCARFQLVKRLNECLAYTIHKFSDYFQELHDEEIKKYTQDLEITVDQRTKQLAESERKYRQLVEEIRDGYFVNQHGRIVFANKAFCELHGYELAEVIGRDFRDFVAPESLEKLRELYEEWRASHQFEGLYTYLRLNKNGTSFPTENKVIMTHYQGDMAVIGICRDITERVEIEKRVREAERLAHIGQLTTSLAHEIRNPLSCASMSIQDLLKSLSVSGNNKRRIEILAEEMARVNRIVTEMLDFAKPLNFDFELVSIKPIVNSCLDILESRILEKRIKIRLGFPENVPLLLLDAEKMVQALINVLLNSIEAVGKHGEIAIVARSGDGIVRIEIYDDGQGISTSDLQYIFDPFFSRKKKGTGLGLANAKKVIEAHGGKIELLPQESGTCALISLPFSERVCGQ